MSGVRWLSWMFAAATVASAGATSVDAKDLVFTTFAPPQNVTTIENVEPVLKQVQKETGLTFKVYTSGSLLGIKATLGGLRDGIADIGFTLPFFYPGELPTVNALHDMIFVGDNAQEVEASSLETFLLDCPECIAEYGRQGAFYLGSVSPPEYVLMCRDPLNGTDSIKGKKIRTTGSYARWVKKLGATPVNMSMAETAEALQRGQIDCVLASMSFLRSFGLIDVVRYIVDYPMGIARATGLYTFNLKTWNGFTADQKKAFLRAVPMGTARESMVYYPKETRESVELAKSRGVIIVPADDKMEALMKEHIAEELKLIPTLWAKRGAKDPQRLVDSYLAKLEKWRAILAKIGNDPVKYEKALYDEIFSKVKI